jgi:hypothetical protein
VRQTPFPGKTVLAYDTGDVMDFEQYEGNLQARHQVTEMFVVKEKRVLAGTKGRKLGDKDEVVLTADLKTRHTEKEQKAQQEKESKQVKKRAKQLQHDINMSIVTTTTIAILYTCTHRYIHTYTHIHTHIHIHTYVSHGHISPYLYTYVH